MLKIGLISEPLEAGDDGFFFVDRTGDDLEDHFTGIFFGLVDVLAAEAHFPDLRMQHIELQRGHIAVSNTYRRGS